MPGPNIYRKLAPVQVEIRTNWTDEWEVRPNVIPMNCSLACDGVGQFQFRVPYGVLKHPTESAIAPHDYTQIQRDWVRVKRFPYTDDDVIFLGRVENDNRDLDGPLAGSPSGMQVFTAYDGVQQLAKRRLHQTVGVYEGEGEGSDPVDPAAYHVLSWMVPINGHPNLQGFLANRSEQKRATGGIDHYVFQAGGWYWDMVDILEYLLAEFMNGSGSSATEPQWYISVPIDPESSDDPPEDHPLFHRGIERIDLKPNTSVLEVIQQVVNRQFGIGWAVIPRADGWELRLFSLAAEDVEYEDVRLPANPNVVNFTTNDPETLISIERSQVQTYGKLRVIGAPMVVVRSFGPDRWEPGWNNFDEEEFAAADYDLQTAGDFNKVWQLFTAKMDPAEWTAAQWPSVAADGTINTATKAPVPQLIKSTLESIPLRNDFRYDLYDPESSDPDINTLPWHGSGISSPPRIWALQSTGSIRFYDLVAETGGRLFTLPGDIGLRLHVQNPGQLARESAVESSCTNPEFVADTVWFTVALESSQRLEFEYYTGSPIDADGVYVIETGAELWYMAPGTFFGLNDDRTARAPTEGIELLNGREYVLRVMVGTIARYTQARSRATVKLKGLHMYVHQLGWIFGATADGTDANLIAAPITGIQYQFEGDYQTTISTGFAI